MNWKHLTSLKRWVEYTWTEVLVETWECLRWVAWEFEHTDETDWCSNWPDLVLGYDLRGPCGDVHDTFYRGRKHPHYGFVRWRIVADLILGWEVFLVVLRTHESVAHFLVGLPLPFLMFLGVFLWGRDAWNQ